MKADKFAQSIMFIFFYTIMKVVKLQRLPVFVVSGWVANVVVACGSGSFGKNIN